MKKVLIFVVCIIIFSMCMITAVLAADGKYDVEVVNNADKKSDIVTVSGIESKSTVSVYSESGVLLAKKSVNTTTVSLKVKLPGAGAGIVKVSILGNGASETEEITAEYSAEPVSESPARSDVTIANNVDTKSTIYIENLESKDSVTVYNEKGKKLVSGKVRNNSDEITLSVAKNKLNKDGGIVYISVKSENMLESVRNEYNYDAQTQSAPPSKENVEITNDIKKGTIVVSNLDDNDTITVYNAATGKKLGSKKCSKNKDEISISATLLKEGGALKITLKKSDELVSEPIEIDYDKQPTTPTLTEDAVDISTYVNNTSDTIYVDDLEGGDVVKVYTSLTGTSTLLKGTVSSSKSDITLSKKSIGYDYVYISVTRKNMLESDRLKAEVPALQESGTINPDNVIITNNAGTASTIYITGLAENTTITVYNKEKSGSTLASGKVAVGNTAITINTAQLSSSGGSVWLTRTDSECLESNRVKIDYGTQKQTDFSDSFDVEITNKSDSASTISVFGLQSGDVIKAYSTATTTTVLTSATCGTSADWITLSTSSLTKSGGTVYLTRTETGCLESKRIPFDYDAVGVSPALLKAQINITNNTSTANTVYVTGLAENTTVKIYDKEKAGSEIGSGKVSVGNTTVTINITQLSLSGGSVWLTQTKLNSSESDRVKIDYNAQKQTEFSDSISVEITNKSDSASTIKVIGLESGDVVKAYSNTTITTVLSSATCEAYSDYVTLSVSSLNKNGGTIYLSLTETNCLESERKEFDYGAVGVSSDLSESQISIQNNTGIASTITVTGLTDGDVITVYNAQISGNTLGSGTVGTYERSTKFNISSLNSAGGSVWITRKSAGLSESGRIKVDYNPTEQSEPVVAGYVTISNNSDTADTVTVKGVEAGDVIKVYKTETATTAWGTATASGAGSVSVSISQLGTDEGSVWITRTSSGKTESNRLEIGYDAESVAPKKDNIIVTNNVGIDSLVSVTGLTIGDIVKVYSSSTSSTPIGSATATSSEVTIKVGQLTSGAGKVYVTITNFGCSESSRTAQDYIAQQTSAAPIYVEITNNANARATVNIKELTAGDCIYVYSDSSGSVLLGSAIVNGTEVTFSITQLNETGGTIYISRISIGKNESLLKAFQYSAAY